MANVNAIALCPKCRSVINHPLPERCPSCQYKFGEISNAHFASPDYLTYQKQDLLNELLATAKEGVLSPDAKTKQSQIEVDHRRWGKEASMADRLAAMEDAYHLLSWVMHADMVPVSFIQELKQLTAIAKRVGALAQAIESFYQAGGQRNVTEARPVRPLPGSDDWSQETAP